MRITLAIVESAYELLRTTPPFRGWQLPESDDVKFVVVPLRCTMARHSFNGTTHTISVCLRHTHLNTLLMTLAHEMVHMVDQGPAEHGAAFRRLAKQVCRQHGWDYGAF